MSHLQDIDGITLVLASSVVETGAPLSDLGPFFAVAWMGIALRHPEWAQARLLGAWAEAGGEAELTNMLADSIVDAFPVNGGGE